MRLSYQRAADAGHCPNETELRDSVKARLGYDPFDPRSGEIISARIAPKGKDLVALLEVRDKSGKLTGSRKIDSRASDCGELFSAMSLAISIAIDPLSISRPRKTPPKPTSAPPQCPVASAAAPPPCPEVEPPTSPKCPAPPEPQSPVRFHAGLGVLTAFGAAPAVAVGFNLQAGARYKAASLSLEGRVDLPASTDTPVGTVASSLRLATLVPCGHLSYFAGCALVSLGGLQGENVALERRDTTFYAAAGARLGAAIPIYGILRARAHADLLATLTRTVLFFGGVETWRTPPLQGALGLAIGADFQ